ncbi:MAG TPA: hypothetical protein VF062_27410 [Candidatus Limnocylindrales bacterium]
MTESVGSRRQFGEGPLSRAVAWIYLLLIVELLFLLAILPGLIPMMLLLRDPSNIPLVALCLVPAGPAVSAAVYALHHRKLDLTDLKPGPMFWRGYRANAVGVLQIWLPLLAFLAIVGIVLTNLDAAGVPTWWAGLLGVLGGVALLAGVNALVITSLFSFRARDIAKLGLYFVLRTKGVALGNLCLLIVAAAVTALFSEVILALLGSVLALALLRNARPMIAVVQKEFVA